MARKKKDEKLENLTQEMEMDLGDPDCLHCQLLYTIGKFTLDRRNSKLDSREVFTALSQVMQQFLNNIRDKETKKQNEEFILSILSESGIHWTKGRMQ